MLLEIILEEKPDFEFFSLVINKFLARSLHVSTFSFESSFLLL